MPIASKAFISDMSADSPPGAAKALIGKRLSSIQMVNRFAVSFFTLIWQSPLLKNFFSFARQVADWVNYSTQERINGESCKNVTLTVFILFQKCSRLYPLPRTYDMVKCVFTGSSFCFSLDMVVRSACESSCIGCPHAALYSSSLEMY